MARVLVLGGGFGGVSAAQQLRLLGPEHEVVLVARSSHFMMGFRKNSELVGGEPMESGRRPLAALEERGIRFVQGTIERFDPAARAVEVEGQTLQGDAVVVALGAEVVADAVPGLAEHALNFYDPAVVPEAAEALRSLREGRVAVGIFGAPYTCPPAPYEAALLASEASEERGDRVEFAAFTPQPMSLPILGRTGCEVVEGRLGLRGIRFMPNAKAESVEDGLVRFEGGGEEPFDVLLAVPPHRCPRVLVDAGLAEPGGWVRVDARTLETPFDGVSAIGDCTAIPLATGMPLPKAGVLAEGEGRVVAERILARLNGIQPEATFDGEGACYLEVGGGQAMMVRGRFLAEPAPDVTLTEASPRYLQDKADYERQRLEEWFGPA
ncbi:MAG TPA: FAD/NAD(P)-binding oxidoreductase [Actinomycetota bacterium]|nr:FAD/NAD(P)-binding oxidoreductase [Actinomycetota bacterium]